MARDEFEDEGLEPEELDPAEVETTDGAWQQERDAGRGGHRWLLLLLLIPVVALVVLQLQPGGSAVSSPTPTHSPPTRGLPQPGPWQPGPPMVSQLRQGFVNAARPWDLFLRTDRSVVRVEVASGRVTRTPVPALASSGPVAFLPTRSGVLIRPRDHVPGYAVPDNEAARRLTGALAKGGLAMPGPDAQHVWVKMTDVVGHPTMALVRTDGRKAGPLIAMPQGKVAWIRPDGGGYALVATRDGVYDAHPKNLQSIPGEVVAAGPTGWLVIGCNQMGQCGRIVVHRVTGVQYDPPGTVAHDFSLRGVMAPDGSHALMVGEVDHSPRARLLDLHTGAVRDLRVLPDLRTTMPSDAIAWSPDSRWALLVDERGGVVAVNVHTRAVRHLDLDLPKVRQLAVRPVH